MSIIQDEGDEYVPDYDDLCHAVEQIDPEAAAYLRGPAKSLVPFNLRSYLIGCFIWDNTPQGHDFWSRLSYKLPSNIPRRPRYYANGLPIT